MKQNVKIAKQLIKLAKHLISNNISQELQNLINNNKSKDIYYSIYKKSIKYDKQQMDAIINYFLQKNNIDTINTFHLLFMRNNLNQQQHDLIFDFFNQLQDGWKKSAFFDFINYDLLTEKQRKITLKYLSDNNYKAIKALLDLKRLTDEQIKLYVQN